MDIDNLASWCNEWQLNINSSKCAVLTFGFHLSDVIPLYNINGVPISFPQSVKDLGIITNNSLNFSMHCHKIVNTAYHRVNLLLRAFSYSNRETLCNLYTVYVRPLLEYCSPIWSPYTLQDIDLIENVQRYFTRRLPCLSQYTYPERLLITGLQSLEIRDYEMTVF
jgi:hypothetical protein